MLQREVEGQGHKVYCLCVPSGLTTRGLKNLERAWPTCSTLKPFLVEGTDSTTVVMTVMPSPVAARSIDLACHASLETGSGLWECLNSLRTLC